MFSKLWAFRPHLWCINMYQFSIYFLVFYFYLFYCCIYLLQVSKIFFRILFFAFVQKNEKGEKSPGIKVVAHTYLKEATSCFIRSFSSSCASFCLLISSRSFSNRLFSFCSWKIERKIRGEQGFESSKI